MRFALITAPILLLVGSCATLTEEPWSITDAGSVGVFGQLGVYEDFMTVTEFTVDDPGGQPVVAEMSTDLVGKFGAAAGVEYFVAKDWSLLGGLDYRVFESEETPGFILDDVSTIEPFMALRWILPPRWLGEGRLRSFLEGRISYVRSTSFDGEVDISLIGTGVPNPYFRFDGDPRWNAGVAAGLLYQFADKLVGQLRVTYELPLSSTGDQVEVAIPPTTLTYEMGIEQEPEGLLVQLGLAYYF